MTKRINDLIYRFSRAKSEAPDNKFILSTNQLTLGHIHVSFEGRLKKSVGLISKKKNNLHV